MHYVCIFSSRVNNESEKKTERKSIILLQQTFMNLWYLQKLLPLKQNANAISQNAGRTHFVVLDRMLFMVEVKA